MSKNRVPTVDDIAFGEDSIGMPTRREPSVGEIVEGVVVSVAGGDVFVDVGAKSEGSIEAQEVTDKDGNITVSVGDTLQAYVVATEPDIVLSYGLGRSHLDQQRLQDAFEMGLPVEGKVTGVNKGGLEVTLGGARAFCPVSQIDAGFCEDPSVYIGQTLRFRIARYEQDGRNMVVSRRALLEEERAEQAAVTRAELSEGAELSGVVTRLQPFGAFVDIGGIEGLVHVSEISHARIEDPADVLEVGQRVHVRVKKIERDPKRPDRERIGLSIRATLGDPWEAGVSALRQGDRVSGKVVRITPFGAFVELVPGVDGLIHVSELANRRIAHPGDVVSVGQNVEPTILDVDMQARRISLSLKAHDAMDDGDDEGTASSPRSADDKARPQQREAREQSAPINTMADKLRAALEKSNKG